MPPRRMDFHANAHRADRERARDCPALPSAERDLKVLPFVRARNEATTDFTDTGAPRGLKNSICVSCVDPWFRKGRRVNGGVEAEVDQDVVVEVDHAVLHKRSLCDEGALKAVNQIWFSFEPAVFRADLSSCTV